MVTAHAHGATCHLLLGGQVNLHAIEQECGVGPSFSELHRVGGGGSAWSAQGSLPSNLSLAAEHLNDHKDGAGLHVLPGPPLRCGGQKTHSSPRTEEQIHVQLFLQSEHSTNVSRGHLGFLVFVFSTPPHF